MRLMVLLLAVPFLFLGCATRAPAPPEGAGARTLVTPSFVFRPGLRVAVLPFMVTGHPERAQDFTEADVLSVKLAEAGFVIIDSTIFRRHNLDLDALLPASDTAAIRRQLNVELIAIGTINYLYDNGTQSLLGKGRYFKDSASLRLVSVSTGEVVMIATARAGDTGLAAAIGESIKLALGQP